MGILDGLWRGEEGCMDRRLTDTKLGMTDKFRGKELRSECEACPNAPSGKRRGKFLMEGNEKAEELVKDGVEMIGGEKAAAKALTRKQLRKELYGSIEYAVQFHVQVEAWQDRAETVTRRRRRN